MHNDEMTDAKKLADELARALYEEHVQFLDDKDAHDWSELPPPIKATWLSEAGKRLAPVVKYVALRAPPALDAGVVDVPLAYYQWRGQIERDVRVWDLTLNEIAALATALRRTPPALDAGVEIDLPIPDRATQAELERRFNAGRDYDPKAVIGGRLATLPTPPELRHERNSTPEEQARAIAHGHALDAEDGGYPRPEAEGQDNEKGSPSCFAKKNENDASVSGATAEQSDDLSDKVAGAIQWLEQMANRFEYEWPNTAQHCRLHVDILRHALRRTTEQPVADELLREARGKLDFDPFDDLPARIDAFLSAKGDEA